MLRSRLLLSSSQLSLRRAAPVVARPSLLSSFPVSHVSSESSSSSHSSRARRCYQAPQVLYFSSRDHSKDDRHHPAGSHLSSTMPKLAAQIPKRKQTASMQTKLETALEQGGEKVTTLDDKLPKVRAGLIAFLTALPSNSLYVLKISGNAVRICLTDPSRALAYLKQLKHRIGVEVKHYWLGSKLLYADVTTSSRICRRLLSGHSLSRRERKQLQRTFTDLIRLVPFSFFIIIPFMELLLPVALKLFPSMLPSTFQDTFQKEEHLKKQLQLRLSLAAFLQSTVTDVLKKTRDSEGESDEMRGTAEEVLDFIERAQSGEPLSNDETLKFASFFSDDLMLDNISRPQLVGMCRFMGLPPYGNDNFLRFQLRNKIRSLKSDDQQIIWEGLESLTKEELQAASLERGMRSTGLTEAGYRRQMKQWLDLSINKNIPTALLIISRALNMTTTESPEVSILATMSSMDEEVVAEVALDNAKDSDEYSAELRELKLESIRYQNEMIEDERADQEEFQEKETLKEEAREASQQQQHNGDTIPPSIPSSSSSSSSDPWELPALTREESALRKRELTLEEISALESLVHTSSVAKERKTLERMKHLKESMDTQKLVAAGRIKGRHTSSSSSSSLSNASGDEKTTHRMQTKLNSMIVNLEKELETVDSTIGDRLNFLDKDRDGVLSAEELKEAIMNILRERNSEEAAAWAVSQIDENKDGKVTVAELVEWIEKRTNLFELTGTKRETIPASTTSSSSHAKEDK